MEKTANKAILFKIIGAQVDKFETEIEKFDEDLDIGVAFSVNFSLTPIENRTAKCSIEFTFKSDGREFISMMVSSLFEIEESYWDNMIDSAANRIVVPENLCLAFFSTTLGVARGVMLVKLEGTIMSHLIIPSIPLSSIKAGDFILDFK